MLIFCCMGGTHRPPIARSRWRRSSGCCMKSVRPTLRRCWCSTSSMRCRRSGVRCVCKTSTNGPGRGSDRAQVERVLHEIGAADIAQMLVFNKLDALPAQRRPLRLQDQYERAGQGLERWFVSARSGEGLDLLRQALAAKVLATPADITPADSVQLPYARP